MNEQQNVELKLIHMEDVVSKEVEWLWYPYIPYGKITIIEGDTSLGYMNVETKEMYSKDEIQYEIKSYNRTGTVEQMDANVEAMARDLQEILRISAEQKRLWDVYEGR